jgi:hypothetical protein
MPNKKISEFSKAISLRDDDIFLMNQVGDTKTTYLSVLSSKITANSITKPTGNNGDILVCNNNNTWVASAANFIHNPAGLNSSNNGNMLAYQSSTSSWVASSANFITKPTGNNGDILVCNNNTWVASAANFIAKPATASNGQVLTYDGSTSTWYAGAGSNTYTTVGNASAGIFASAVCFIPSSSGTGIWTAPAGCYTARVTVVGGGGGQSVTSGMSFGSNGKDSRFNYPSGTTPGANQLYAQGGGRTFINGGYDNKGGDAGWNGIKVLGGGGFNVLLPVGVLGGAAAGGGAGGAGAGGYGGGGGGGAFGNGGSYGSSGIGAGGGSGGINGDGKPGITSTQIGMSVNFYTATPGGGGGCVPLSYAATMLPNFTAAIAQSPGYGNYSGGGAGWATAIVSVTPGNSYSYSVGDGGGLGVNKGSHGMVVIEW